MQRSTIFLLFTLGAAVHIRELVETGKGNVPAEKNEEPFSGEGKAEAVSCLSHNGGTGTCNISVEKRRKKNQIRYI